MKQFVCSSVLGIKKNSFETWKQKENWICIKNGWCSSIKVARAIKLHTAVVSNFLALCAEYGILEKRFVRWKRYEYKLKASELERTRILREVLAYCKQDFGDPMGKTIESSLNLSPEMQKNFDSGGRASAEPLQGSKKIQFWNRKAGEREQTSCHRHWWNSSKGWLSWFRSS